MRVPYAGEHRFLKETNPDRWASRPQLYDLGYLTQNDNLNINIDKNMGGGVIYNNSVSIDRVNQLRAIVYHLKARLNQHLDKAKDSSSIWTNDG